MPKWTAEMDAKLRKLHSEGLSCSQIAGWMGGGLSRNAVIGRCNRLGLIHRSRQGSPSSILKPSRVMEKATKPSRISVLTGVEALKSVAEKMRAAEPKIPIEIKTEDCLGVSLIDLTPSCCRWPLNDPARGEEFLFCGGVRVEGRPYCSEHLARAYVGVPQPRKRARPGPVANFESEAA